MATALDKIMTDAENAATAFSPPAVGGGSSLIPIPANNNTALARPSMDDFIDGGGMDVDEYFRVKAEGFRIGDTMQGLVEEMTVEIDLSEVTPVYSARFESGGNTIFIKSYDGASTPDGKNFQAEVDRLTKTNQKASGVYHSAEIPVELVDDVADPKRGSSVVINAGTRVGYTPSVTGFKPFQSFMKKLRRDNPELMGQTVKVKLTHEKRVKGSNEWGVLNFALAE